MMSYHRTTASARKWQAQLTSRAALFAVLAFAVIQCTGQTFLNYEPTLLNGSDMLEYQYRSNQMNMQYMQLYQQQMQQKRIAEANQNRTAIQQYKMYYTGFNEYNISFQDGWHNAIMISESYDYIESVQVRVVSNRIMEVNGLKGTVLNGIIQNCKSICRWQSEGSTTPIFCEFYFIEALEKLNQK